MLYNEKYVFIFFIYFYRLKEAINEVMPKLEAEYFKEFTKAAGTRLVIYFICTIFPCKIKGKRYYSLETRV